LLASALTSTMLSNHRKTGTAVLTAGTAFHVVFQVDYGDHDHAFTDIQKWYRKKVDDVLIGDISVHSNPSSSSSTNKGTGTGTTDEQLNLNSNINGGDQKETDR